MFGKLFNRREQGQLLFDKIELVNQSQIVELKQKSFEKPAIIFKHSTRCGISGSVLRRFDKIFDDFSDKYDYYFLDLLKHRGISKAIAQDLGVEHQSPQVIIIKEGMVNTYLSHYEILGIEL